MTVTNFDFGPTLDELDFAGARTDSDLRIATAEELAAYHAYEVNRKHLARLEIYALEMQLLHLGRILVNRGYSEYAQEVNEVTARLDEIRADEILRTAVATAALDKLRNDYERMEFACLTWRVAHDFWPTDTELVDCYEQFGWHDGWNTLERAFNDYSQETVGLFMIEEDDLIERMQFPRPDHIPSSFQVRVYVSAECQHRHKLHKIHRRWDVRTVTEGDQ